MRILPTALAGHLAGGATTLCRCWRLIRKDGAVFGFTDHDRDIAFAGVTFAAASGLAPGEAEAQLGMAVSTGEVSGALSGLNLTETDIVAGLYDDAEVTGYLVNWADPAQRLVTEQASIGEIRRQDGTFVAELRGPMHRYDQEQGRLYTASCSAEFGDSRCGLSLASHTTGGVVTEVVSRLVLEVPDLAPYPEGRFSGGRISFTSGPNAGHTRLIRHQGESGRITLWEAFPADVETGDSGTFSAGCDKTYQTCRTIYANAVNFRGFPDIPTPDFVLTYARPGEGGHDGSRLDP